MVLLVGIFSVTLKSRPSMKWFAKAKSSSEKKQENMVMPLCSGNTQEVSGDQTNRMLSSVAPVINILWEASQCMFCCVFNAYGSKYHERLCLAGLTFLWKNSWRKMFKKLCRQMYIIIILSSNSTQRSAKDCAF